ncbi:DHA1 family tetracycline resistance protein-like MFS transporter [Sphingomonas zeicaulis]|uniref:TCR/Tet family MFS transporter n=1 Tax=Sphingomonas zeicaulis TaxID=1632740 RepID=UPI003D215464
MSAAPSTVRFVLMTILIDAVGFGIVIPVLPDLVMTVGKVGLADATRIGGWLALLYAVFQFLLGPAIGNLADRFGRRPILLGSLAGYAVDYVLMAFAPTLAWLFVGRALAGVFGGTYGPAQAAIADITAPAERAKLFGYIGAAFGIGFIAGPAVGGLLGAFGPRAPFYAAAALAAFNLFYGLFFFPETLPAQLRRRFDWKRANPLGALISFSAIPGLLPVAAVYFLWQVASLVYPTAWSWFAIARFDWSSLMIGASLAFVGVTMVIVQVGLTGRIVAKVGERRTAEIGIAGAILGFALFMLIPQGWMAFPVMAVVALQSVVQPSLSAMLSRRVPADQQGELQGFGGSLMSLGAIVAPVTYSPALAWFTSDDAPFRFPGVVFAIAIVAALCALAVLVATPRARRGEEQVAAESEKSLGAP